MARFDQRLGRGALQMQVFHVVSDQPIGRKDEPGDAARKEAQGVSEAGEAQVAKLFAGRKVAAVTLRIKPGDRKSWALLTFESKAAAEAAVAAGVEFGGQPLKVELASVRAHLRDGG